MVKDPTWYLNVLQVIVFLIIIAGAAYGFVRGDLPFWIGGLVKWECEDDEEMTLGKLTNRINKTHDTVGRLETKHRRVSEELHDVKSAQIDIARAVNRDDKAVPVRALEEMHFGEGPRRGDFVTDRDDLGCPSESRGEEQD